MMSALAAFSLRAAVPPTTMVLPGVDEASIKQQFAEKPLQLLEGIWVYPNEEMKLAAAKAIASLVSDEELNADYILPKAFDDRVGPTVAKAVAEAARKSGVARI